MKNNNVLKLMFWLFLSGMILCGLIVLTNARAQQNMCEVVMLCPYQQTAGAGGSSGSGGNSGKGGSGGTGGSAGTTTAAGTGGVSGTSSAGAGGSKAGTGGSAAAGTGGSSGAPGHAGTHGGTDVVGDLPVGDTGSSGFDINRTGEMPSAASDGVGAFRSVCQITKYAWDDPIVYPGKPGVAHLHMFWGNSAIDAFSTAQSLKTSGNGTCRGGIANRSSYWIPAVLSSEGRVLVPHEVHSYYKREYALGKSVPLQRIPPGLKIISGDMKASSTQNIQRYSYKCWNTYTGDFATLTGPKCKSGDFLSVNVFFPQCWDGKNLDSADHKSHMTWPAGGTCPASHPVALPGLSSHILYKAADVTAAGSNIHLSSDMYTVNGNGGYSLHADFFEAWDDDIAATFTKLCVNDNKDCKSHMIGDGRIMN